MNSTINVTKRNGSLEPLNVDKIHKMVAAACDGLADVSASQIEMNANLQFYDKIPTSGIQSILVRSASDLISLDNSNYQYAAARLLLFHLKKTIFGSIHKNTGVPLKEHISNLISLGLYDKNIIDWYSDEEFDELYKVIDNNKDYKFTHSALRQIIDKYLVQNRTTKKVYEMPQYMYMMISLVLFHEYPKDVRLDYVKRYYEAISDHKINLPTPILAGVRTPNLQYSSCVLVDVEDSLDGIFSADVVLGQYTARRAGIGLNVGKIRGVNSQIRGGEVSHTGIVPFLKKFEATSGCCTQNGIRGGAVTSYCMIWHQEISDIVVLKNNKGSENNRVRNMDYGIQISKLFYQRLLNKKKITLFSPHDVPELVKNWGLPEFDELYEMYERDDSIPKTTVDAQELFFSIMKERAETGRIYIMNVDHANTHSPFNIPVSMSNLCAEVILPTSPVNIFNNKHEGEIALCILSAVNLGKINNLDEIEEVTDLICRSLNCLIDLQDYAFIEAKKSAVNRRPIGVGFIGLAEYLAKHNVGYEESAFKLVHQVSEYIQYYLLKSSNQQAKESNFCHKYLDTKYYNGILPIDTYKSDINTFADFPLELPWEELRSNIKKHGLRNSTLTAQMPSESSSVVANTTNGIEPPRDFLTIKKSKKGTLKQIVPGYNKLKNNYTLAWDMTSNTNYLKICAIIQKFFDQSISTNVYYNPEHYPNGEIPMSVMVGDLLNAYKWGIKTLYYHNTFDGKTEQVEETPMSDKELLQEIYELSKDIDDCGACTI